MKQVFILICGLAAVNGIAGDDSKLFGLLATAATNRCATYLEARAEILAPGTNALPALGRCAVASDMTWQQRLVARICYERLSRGADIDALRAYDWRTDKGYDKRWEQYITGPSAKLGTIIVPKCRVVGLWHYYLELAWKETGELPVCGKCLKPIQEYAPRERDAELTRRDKEGLRACIHGDGRFRGCWPQWCLDAVADGPERYWYLQTVSERMLGSPFSSWHQSRYETFLREKDSNSVPILVLLSETYFRKNAVGSETYPGAYEDTFRGTVLPILALADSRHADMLEKFISEKPALEPLKMRLVEVRARPAPPPVSEPTFRLGTNSVMSRHRVVAKYSTISDFLISTGKSRRFPENDIAHF